MDMNIREVAHLARLELSAEDAERLERQLSRVLEHVQTLEELDTEGVSPTTHVVSLSHPLREDITEDGLVPDDVLGNAPEQDGGSFVVPRVV